MDVTMADVKVVKLVWSLNWDVMLVVLSVVLSVALVSNQVILPSAQCRGEQKNRSKGLLS